MDKQFPHLPGSDRWPGYGRDVYDQIEGSFDPDLWEEGATITLCSVPWGVYEAGVCDDVPGFDSPQERDLWFSQWLNATHTESHILDTAIRYQLSRTVELPFTFDSLARYNYLIVDYPEPPVPEAAAPDRRWYYHITDYDYESPSCTALTLRPDWWCQCACEMDYSHMMLARGHAPVSMVTTTQFLSAPLSHTRWLMGDDPSYGELTKISTSCERVFNSGTQWIVLCFAGISLDLPLTPEHDGPAPSTGMIAQGGPGDYQLAVKMSDYTNFMRWLEANNPKYLFYIEAAFLVDESLISFDRTYTMGGFTVKAGTHGQTLTTQVQLTEEAFGYPQEAAQFAKLYTFPYAMIEIADHKGNVLQVRIEDLEDSSVTATSVFNAAYPWLQISTHVAGIGGKTRALTFKTLDRTSFQAGGRWWDAIFSWGVPCFKIDVANSIRNDALGYWDRVQAKNDADTALANANASADNAYGNAVRSADTAYANAKANADTALTNANASADTAYANATASNSTANTNAKASNATALANNGRINDNATATKNLKNSYNTSIQAADHERLVTHTANGNNVITAMTDADITLSQQISELTNTEIAMTTSLNNVSGAVGAAGNVIGGALEMGPAGALDAVGDVINTGISNMFASTAANIAISKNETITGAAQRNSRVKLTQALSQNAYNQGYADVVSHDHMTRANALADGVTAANVATSAANASASAATGNANADRTLATGNANATRSRDTAKANAQRTHDTALTTAAATQTASKTNAQDNQAIAKANAKRSYDNALAAINNEVRTANLQPSVTMGASANGETFNTRPMYLSVNVITQNEGAIMRAASQFARYGYRLDAEWQFQSFNLCKHFTYWQVSSVWANAPYKLPETGQDAVRRMLYDGITAWKNPEEIGTVSIYDN